MQNQVGKLNMKQNKKKKNHNITGKKYRKDNITEMPKRIDVHENEGSFGSLRVSNNNRVIGSACSIEDLPPHLEPH